MEERILKKEDNNLELGIAHSSSDFTAEAPSMQAMGVSDSGFEVSKYEIEAPNKYSSSENESINLVQEHLNTGIQTLSFLVKTG